MAEVALCRDVQVQVKGQRVSRRVLLADVCCSLIAMPASLLLQVAVRARTTLYPSSRMRWVRHHIRSGDMLRRRKGARAVQCAMGGAWAQAIGEARRWELWQIGSSECGG